MSGPKKPSADAAGPFVVAAPGTWAGALHPRWFGWFQSVPGPSVMKLSKILSPTSAFQKMYIVPTPVPVSTSAIDGVAPVHGATTQCTFEVVGGFGTTAD